MPMFRQPHSHFTQDRKTYPVVLRKIASRVRPDYLAYSFFTTSPPFITNFTR
jgi:hypothetical protein